MPAKISESELDEWVETATKCSYLAEHDLKANRTSLRLPIPRKMTLWCLLASLRLRVRSLDGRVERTTGFDSGNGLRRHSRTGTSSLYVAVALRCRNNGMPLQFYDLEELFRTGGQVPNTNYIFMVRRIEIETRMTSIRLVLGRFCRSRLLQPRNVHSSPHVEGQVRFATRANVFESIRVGIHRELLF